MHSGTLAQYVLQRYVANADAFEAHVRTIEETYARRRDVMLAALSEFMPPQVEFNRPEGGMFLWARVPGADTDELLQDAAKQNVAFVPGVSFYPARDVRDGMRLNFSNASEENIRIGIERLATSVTGRI